MEEEEEGGHRRAEVASRRRPSVSRERPSEDERERERGVEEKLPEGGIRTRSWDSNEKLEKVERSRETRGKVKIIRRSRFW
jgi:hypothetical protein